MNAVVYVDCQRIGIRSPRDVVSIGWEVDGGSGSTDCEAWRVQHEMDKLTAAGYRLVSVRVIAHNGASMDAVTVAAMLSLCERRKDEGEFWQRLAGSIRKAATMV